MDTLTRMRSFVDVVRAGGYSAAARETGRSKAVLSKDVRELEDYLGVRLLTRTTRSVVPTDTGQTYFEEAVEVLASLDSLQERTRERSDVPRGRLRVSAPRTHSDGVIGEAIMDFATTYRDVQLDVVYEDRFIDIVAERFDVAIRISQLADSSLIARKLAPYRIVVCATPDVIAQYGTPQTPDDVAKLPTIVDSNHRVKNAYGFDTPDGRVAVRVQAVMSLNAPHAVRRAALAGLGFCQVPYLTVQADVEAGRLVTVLDPFEIQGAGVHVVYPERRHMPMKLRAFIDHMAKRFG